MFDLRKAIKVSGLSKKEVICLEKEVKKEYPRDQMLYELHMIRALKVRNINSSGRKMLVHS